MPDTHSSCISRPGIFYVAVVTNRRRNAEYDIIRRYDKTDQLFDCSSSRFCRRRLLSRPTQATSPTFTPRSLTRTHTRTRPHTRTRTPRRCSAANKMKRLHYTTHSVLSATVHWFVHVTLFSLTEKINK